MSDDKPKCHILDDGVGTNAPLVIYEDDPSAMALLFVLKRELGERFVTDETGYIHRITPVSSKEP